MPTFTRTHLVMAVTLVIVLASTVGLSWAFAEQVVLSREMRQVENELERELSAARERNEQLQELEERVATNAFVEDWAHERLVWAREGEAMVVYVDPLPEFEGPARAPAAEAEVEETPLWREVWELIVGR